MQIIHSSLPLLSIIIPIHNGKNEIERCLNSIYSQNIEQDLFEVICVDDASTDETCKILSQWAEKRKNLNNTGTSKFKKTVCFRSNAKKG